MSGGEVVSAVLVWVAAGSQAASASNAATARNLNVLSLIAGG
jgi:hypothetical protein